jgi:hypothetical protein
MRYRDDITATYKQSDKLSFVVEANYLHDGGYRDDLYDVAGCVLYQMMPQLALNTRAEVFRDNNGSFVASYLSNTGFTKALAGLPTPIETAAPTTYSELTIGLNDKPAFPQGRAKVTIRPECAMTGR